MIAAFQGFFINSLKIKVYGDNRFRATLEPLKLWMMSIPARFFFQDRARQQGFAPKRHQTPGI